MRVPWCHVRFVFAMSEYTGTYEGRNVPIFVDQKVGVHAMVKKSLFTKPGDR